MKITWYVSDGYLTGDRPQVVEIDDDELRACKTHKEVEKLIDDFIKYEFEAWITYDYEISQEIYKLVDEG